MTRKMRVLHIKIEDDPEVLKRMNHKDDFSIAFYDDKEYCVFEESRLTGRSIKVMLQNWHKHNRAQVGMELDCKEEEKHE